MAAGKWTGLVDRNINVGRENWAPDGRAILYQDGTEIRRIAIADRRTEVVANSSDLDLAVGQLGPWIGYTPDGMPMVLLDAGTHDIYALDWVAP